MDWIQSESFWLRSPDFTDVFVGREALQGMSASFVLRFDLVNLFGNLDNMSKIFAPKLQLFDSIVFIFWHINCDFWGKRPQRCKRAVRKYGSVNVEVTAKAFAKMPAAMEEQRERKHGNTNPGMSRQGRVKYADSARRPGICACPVTQVGGVGLRLMTVKITDTDQSR